MLTLAAISTLSLLLGASIRAYARETERLAAQHRSIRATTGYAGSGGYRNV